MKQAIAFTILALAVGAMTIYSLRPSIQVTDANVVATTSGIVTALVTDSDGPFPVRMAVVELMDGSVIEVPVLPGCEVRLGEVANLSILQARDSAARTYIVTGSSGNEL